MAEAKVVYTCGCEATSFDGTASAVCLAHPGHEISDIRPAQEPETVEDLAVLFKSKDYSVTMGPDNVPEVHTPQNSPLLAHSEVVLCGHLTFRVEGLAKAGFLTPQERAVLIRALSVLHSDALHRLAFPK